MDKETDWKQKPIIAITITPNTNQVNKQITKSFTAELIGILGALQITHQYKIKQNISTDCQSATKLLNPQKPAEWAHHPQNQLLSAIHRLKRNELKWTPSHPERKKKNTSEYTKEECGITLADGACEGNPKSPEQNQHVSNLATNLNITHITISTEEILSNILEDAPYAWTMENIPIITNIQTILEEKRVIEYRANRDTFAWNNCTRTPKYSTFWQEATLKHSALAKKRAKLTKDQFLRAVAIIFDWKEDGRNRAKTTTNQEKKEETERCKLCNDTDSQQHTLRECQENALIEIRKEADERIDNYIRKCELNDYNDQTPQVIRDHIKHSNTHKIMLGLWTTTEQEALANKLNINDAPKWSIYIKRDNLLEIISIYIQSAIKLVYTKRKIEAEAQKIHINTDKHTTQHINTTNDVQRKSKNNENIQDEQQQQELQIERGKKQKEEISIKKHHTKKSKKMIIDSSSDDEATTQTQIKNTTQNTVEKIKLKGRPKFNINSKENIEHFKLISIKRKKNIESEKNEDNGIANLSRTTDIHPQQQQEHHHKKARTSTSMMDWLVRDSTRFKK